MPILVTCHSCGNSLQAPDRLAGRKAKCASCGSIVVVSEVSIPEAILVSGPKAKPKSRPRPAAQDDEPVWAVPIQEPVRQEAALAADIVDAEPANGPEDVAWVEDVADPVETAPRRKKTKRKKRRESDRSEKTGVGVGIWWAISVGALALIILPIVLWANYAGHLGDVVYYAICMGVMLPVSLVVLVISMYATSYFGGGVDFGEVQTAIPKALLLLTLMNFVAVVLPWWVGFIFGFPLFFILVLVLFRLDFWEAGFLSFANSQLNQLIFIFAIAALLHGMGGGFGGPGPDILPPQEREFGDDRLFPGPGQLQFQENDPRLQDESDEFPQPPRPREPGPAPKKTRTARTR
jgi:hypothetical protein